jgi:hypothetical protein
VSWLVWNNLVSLTVGTIAGVWFLGLYTKRTNWWAEEHRAHLGYFTAIVVIFYLLYSVRTFTQPFNAPGSSLTTFNVIRGIMFDALTAGIVWRLSLLLRSKVSDHKRTDREDVERAAE